MIDTHNVTPDTLNATAKEERNSEDTGIQGRNRGKNRGKNREKTGKDRRNREETGKNTEKEKRQGRNREETAKKQ